jgi:hypothetical protein
VAKLSDTRIRGVKPRAKRFKLFDGEGLFLIVTPQGGAMVASTLSLVRQREVRVAYNAAQYLVERRRMMQSWADYLDGLKFKGNVVPLRRAARYFPAQK